MDETTFVEKEPLILREYGRNVQKLVQYITTLKTIEERTQAAHTLINLMKQLNPSVKENNDNMQRVWDHLHHMANFQLDINSPYPMPSPEDIYQKPKALGYSTHTPKYRHYGRNIELLVEKATTIEDAELLLYTVKNIVQMMKSFYVAWNNDNIEESVLLTHIKHLSNGKINISPRELQEVDIKNNRKQYSQQRQGHNNQHRTPHNNRPNNGGGEKSGEIRMGNKKVVNNKPVNAENNRNPNNSINNNSNNNPDKRKPYHQNKDNKNFKK
jgi:hypothetical protein